ncbi:MAG: S8/S53 family peptidase [Solirubrobacterales bacterium]
MILPEDASVSSAAGPESDSGRWIIGAVPGAESRQIARREGATAVDLATGIYSTGRDRANQLASALREAGLLVYAEPNVRVAYSGFPSDYNPEIQWWLNRIADTVGVTPPPVTPNSPQLGLVEESLDATHPDLVLARLTGALSLGSLEDNHGTAVAAIAGSPGGDVVRIGGGGIVGVWPGMNMTLFPSGDDCLGATEAVLDAVRAKVVVINMSYGFASTDCFSHFLATENAVRKGILPVAAAGNTFDKLDNLAVRPAADPHVISVSAVDSANLVAGFATRNDAVDITAPGVQVYSPWVSERIEGDSSPPWALNSGTSFSAPMVSAAATWLTQARPALDARQIGRLLTSSATDLGEPGRDPLYGEGLLNISSALTAKAPPADPREPNDDIGWINGSLLSGKASFVWYPARRRASTVTATLSRSKDPADVYRVLIAPRSQVQISADQYQGDVSLRIFRPSAKTTLRTGKQLIVASDRPRPATEGVIVRNSKRRPQEVYVAVAVSRRWNEQYLRYRLAVSKRR